MHPLCGFLAGTGHYRDMDALAKAIVRGEGRADLLQARVLAGAEFLIATPQTLSVGLRAAFITIVG